MAWFEAHRARSSSNTEQDSGAENARPPLTAAATNIASSREKERDNVARMLKEGIEKREISSADILETIGKLPFEARNALINDYKRVNDRSLQSDFAYVLSLEDPSRQSHLNPGMDAFRILLAPDPEKARAEIGIEILKVSGWHRSQLPARLDDYRHCIERFMAVSFIRLPGEQDPASTFVSSIVKHWPDLPDTPQWRTNDHFRDGLTLIPRFLECNDIQTAGNNGFVSITSWLAERANGKVTESAASEFLLLARVGALDPDAIYKLVTSMPPKDFLAFTDAVERSGNSSSQSLSFSALMNLPEDCALSRCIAGMKKAGASSSECDKLLLGLRCLKAMNIPVDSVVTQQTKREYVQLNDMRAFFAGLSPQQRSTLSECVFGMVNIHSAKLFNEQRESFIKREVESQGRGAFLEWVSKKEHFIKEQHSRYLALSSSLKKDAQRGSKDGLALANDSLSSTVDQVVASFKGQKPVAQIIREIADDRAWHAGQAEKYTAILDEELASLHETVKTFRESREQNIRDWVSGHSNSEGLKCEQNSFGKLATEYQISTEAGHGNFIILSSGKKLRPVEIFISRIGISQEHSQDLEKAIKRCDSHIEGIRFGLVIGGGTLVTIATAGAGSGVLVSALSGIAYSAGLTAASSAVENAVRVADGQITFSEAGERVFLQTGQMAIDQAKSSVPVGLGVRAGYNYFRAAREIGRATAATPLVAGLRGGIVAGAAGNGISSGFQIKDCVVEFRSRPEGERTEEFRYELLKKHRLTPAQLVRDFVIDTYVGGLMGSAGVAVGGIRHAASMAKTSPGLKQTLGFGLDFGTQLSLQSLHQGAKTGKLEITAEQVASSLAFAAGAPLLNPAKKPLVNEQAAAAPPAPKTVPIDEVAPALSLDLKNLAPKQPVLLQEQPAPPRSFFARVAKDAHRPPQQAKPVAPEPAPSTRSAETATPLLDAAVSATDRKLALRRSPPTAAPEGQTPLEQVLANTEQQQRVKDFLAGIPEELAPKGPIRVSANNRAIFLDTPEQVNQLYLAVKAKQLKSLPQYRDHAWNELFEIAKAGTSHATGAFADVKTGIMILPKLSAPGRSLRTGTLSAEQINLRSLAVEEWAHLNGQGETPAWTGRLGYLNRNQTAMTFENGLMVPKLAETGARPAPTTLAQINEHLAAHYTLDELILPGRIQRSSGAPVPARPVVELELDAPEISALPPTSLPPLDPIYASRLLHKANQLAREGVHPNDSLTVLRLQEALAHEYHLEILPYVGHHNMAYAADTPPPFSVVRNPVVIDLILDKAAARQPGKLYSVSEEDGKYCVLVPAFSTNLEDRQLRVGLTKLSFPTEHEAMDFSRRHRTESFERQEIALYQHYAKQAGIASVVKRLPDGQISLVINGHTQSEMRKFPAWNEARAELDARFRAKESLGQSYISFPLEDGRIFSVTSLQDFKPRPRLLSEPDRLPHALAMRIVEAEQISERNNATYLNTISDPAWQKQIFGFLENYLKNSGSHIKRDLGISSLNELTPEQAAKLSVRVVEELFRFNKESMGQKNLTREDRMSALEILKEGLLFQEGGPGAEQWKGNGVCRNASDTVKAIFEALKASQPSRNLLLNTYCLIESGFDHTLTNPIDSKNVAHAWNSFVSLTSDGIQYTVVDATWSSVARQSSKLGQNEYRDYTKLRAHAMVMTQFQSIPTKAPILPVAARRVHQFIDGAFAVAGDSVHLASPEQAFPHLAQKALRVALRSGIGFDVYLNAHIIDVICNYPERLPSTFRHKFLEAQATQTPEVLFTICEKIFANVPRTEASAEIFMSEHSATQEVILRYLRHTPSAFSQFLDTSPTFRAHVRKVSPKDLPPFNPERNRADFAELSDYLRREYSTSTEVISFLDKSLRAQTMVLDAKNASTLAELLSQAASQRGGKGVSPDAIRGDWLKYSRDILTAIPLPKIANASEASAILERLRRAHGKVTAEESETSPSPQPDVRRNSAPPPAERTAAQSRLVEVNLDRISRPSASINHAQAFERIEELAKNSITLNKAEAATLEGVISRWEAERKFQGEELEALKTIAAKYVCFDRNSEKQLFQSRAGFEGRDNNAAGVLADRLEELQDFLAKILSDKKPALLDDCDGEFEERSCRQQQYWNSFLERTILQLRYRFTNGKSPQADYYTIAEATLAEKLFGVPVFCPYSSVITNDHLEFHLRAKTSLPPAVQIQDGAFWSLLAGPQRRIDMLRKLHESQHVDLSGQTLSSMMDGLSVSQKLSVFEYLGDVDALNLSHVNLAAAFHGMNGAERYEALRSLSRVRQLRLSNVDLGAAMEGMSAAQRLEIFRYFGELRSLSISLFSTSSFFSDMSPGQKIQVFKYLGRIDHLALSRSGTAPSGPWPGNLGLGMSQLSGAQQLEALAALGNVKCLELGVTLSPLMNNMTPEQAIELFRALGKTHALTFTGFPLEHMLPRMDSGQRAYAEAIGHLARARRLDFENVAIAECLSRLDPANRLQALKLLSEVPFCSLQRVDLLALMRGMNAEQRSELYRTLEKFSQLEISGQEQELNPFLELGVEERFALLTSLSKLKELVIPSRLLYPVLDAALGTQRDFLRNLIGRIGVPLP